MIRYFQLLALFGGKPAVVLWLDRLFVNFAFGDVLIPKLITCYLVRETKNLNTQLRLITNVLYLLYNSGLLSRSVMMDERKNPIIRTTEIGVKHAKLQAETNQYKPPFLYKISVGR